MKRILIICSLAFAACGSDNTSGIDSFIESIATQQCGWEFRCCTDAEIKAQDHSKFTAQSDCVPYRKLGLQDELFSTMLAARQGRLRLDHDKSQACLAQMMMMACNAKPNQPATMPGMTLDACADVFVGTTSVGQPCQFAMECEKGAHCVFNKLTPSVGVCEPYQKSGDICNASTDCDPSVTQLYCAQQDWKCRVRAKLGEKCAFTLDGAGKPQLPLLVECDNSIGNAYCDPVSSTCKQLPAAGEPCLSPPPPGVSSSCDPDPKLHLTCRTSGTSTSGVCMGLAKNGESCSSIACDTGLYCDSSTGTTSTCRPLPTLGQSCSLSGQCALPYFCNFNKSPAACDQPAQLNQPCSNGAICDVGLWCDTTPAMPLCKSKLADGTACTSSLQCLSSDCSATTPRVCNPTPPSAVLCIGRI
ncbi:MAG: Tryptophan synthase alpha chain [bacterium]|nr:Tryptophan synthase alpha chain [bacterium]